MTMKFCIEQKFTLDFLWFYQKIFLAWRDKIRGPSILAPKLVVYLWFYPFTNIDLKCQVDMISPKVSLFYEINEFLGDKMKETLWLLAALVRNTF